MLNPWARWIFASHFSPQEWLKKVIRGRNICLPTCKVHRPIRCLEPLICSQACRNKKIPMQAFKYTYWERHRGSYSFNLEMAMFPISTSLSLFFVSPSHTHIHTHTHTLTHTLTHTHTNIHHRHMHFKQYTPSHCTLRNTALPCVSPKSLKPCRRLLLFLH